MSNSPGTEPTPADADAGKLMDGDKRRLLSRAVKAEDDAQHLRERLAACYRELEETRRKVPRDFHQVAFDQPPAPVASDPLVRLFATIAPAPR